MDRNPQKFKSNEIVVYFFYARRDFRHMSCDAKSLSKMFVWFLRLFSRDEHLSSFSSSNFNSTHLIDDASKLLASNPIVLHMFKVLINDNLRWIFEHSPYFILDGMDCKVHWSRIVVKWDGRKVYVIDEELANCYIVYSRRNIFNLIKFEFSWRSMQQLDDGVARCVP